jgi:tetratricopeptide (TPR) repeat protein
MISGPLAVGIELKPTAIVGRQTLMDRVWRRLTENQDASVPGGDAVLLSGLPGIGKRSIAHALARRALASADGRQEFPDGACAATIGANSSEWMFRLEKWATQLGIEPDIYQRPRQSKKPEELLAILHEALSDRRALLIFEDVRSKQEAALLATVGYNCQRLFTTRYTFVASEGSSSAGVFQLEPLDAEDAYTLIAQRAPEATTAMSEEVRRLVKEVIDGIPLAIEIVGRNLDEQFLAGGTPAARDFLGRLRSVSDVLTLEQVSSEERSLKAVLDVTADDLSPNEVRALSYLSVFPPRANDFSKAAATSVSGDEEHVSRLRSTGLLELSQPDLGRYAMHRVIGEYARRAVESDPGAGVDEAYRRMAEYFIAYVTAPPPDPEQREKWLKELEYEGDNLREALRWAIRASEPLMALQLMSKLWPFWYHRSQFRRAREVAGELLEMAEPEHVTQQYFELRSQLLNDDGNFAYNMAEFSDAERRHLEALELRERLNDVGLQSGSWNNLALIDRERGDLDSATRRLEDARSVNAAPTGRPVWLATNLNNLGLVAECRGNFAAAAVLQQQSIETFEAAGERWGVDMASIDKAMSRLWGGETAEAERMLMRALRDRWEMGDRKALAAAMRGLTLVAHRVGDATLARRRLDSAFSLSSGVTDRLGQERALELLVMVAGAQDDWSSVAMALAGVDTYVEMTHAQIPPHRRKPVEAVRSLLVERSGHDLPEYDHMKKQSRPPDDFLDLRPPYGEVAPWDLVEETVTQTLGDGCSQPTLDGAP